MAIQLGQASALNEANIRTWWRAITMLLVLALFSQAVFAGAMLSGVDWARMVHKINALVLIAASVVAVIASALTLRRVRHGPKLSLVLLALAVAIFVQMALGTMSAKGANLMWLHVPLGVALVGLAGQSVAVARKLGSEP
jgi:heme A synthase